MSTTFKGDLFDMGDGWKECAIKEKPLINEHFLIELKDEKGKDLHYKDILSSDVKIKRMINIQIGNYCFVKLSSIVYCRGIVDSISYDPEDNKISSVNVYLIDSAQFSTVSSDQIYMACMQNGFSRSPPKVVHCESYKTLNRFESLALLDIQQNKSSIWCKFIRAPAYLYKMLCLIKFTNPNLPAPKLNANSISGNSMAQRSYVYNVGQAASLPQHVHIANLASLQSCNSFYVTLDGDLRKLQLLQVDMSSQWQNCRKFVIPPEIGDCALWHCQVDMPGLPTTSARVVIVDVKSGVPPGGGDVGAFIEDSTTYMVKLVDYGIVVASSAKNLYCPVNQSEFEKTPALCIKCKLIGSDDKYVNSIENRKYFTQMLLNNEFKLEFCKLDDKDCMECKIEIDGKVIDWNVFILQNFYQLEPARSLPLHKPLEYTISNVCDNPSYFYVQLKKEIKDFGVPLFRELEKCSFNRAKRFTKGELYLSWHCEFSWSRVKLIDDACSDPELSGTCRCPTSEHLNVVSSTSRHSSGVTPTSPPNCHESNSSQSINCLESNSSQSTNCLKSNSSQSINCFESNSSQSIDSQKSNKREMSNNHDESTPSQSLDCCNDKSSVKVSASSLIRIQRARRSLLAISLREQAEKLVNEVDNPSNLDDNLGNHLDKLGRQKDNPSMQEDNPSIQKDNPSMKEDKLGRQDKVGRQVDNPGKLEDNLGGQEDNPVPQMHNLVIQTPDLDSSLSPRMSVYTHNYAVARNLYKHRDRDQHEDGVASFCNDAHDERLIADESDRGNCCRAVKVEYVDYGLVRVIPRCQLFQLPNCREFTVPRLSYLCTHPLHSDDRQSCTVDPKSCTDDLKSCTNVVEHTSDIRKRQLLNVVSVERNGTSENCEENSYVVEFVNDCAVKKIQDSDTVLRLDPRSKTNIGYNFIGRLCRIVNNKSFHIVNTEEEYKLKDIRDSFSAKSDLTFKIRSRHILKGDLCIVEFPVNTFSRGIVLADVENGEHKVKVDLFDYANVVIVTPDDLYDATILNGFKKHCAVPLHCSQIYDDPVNNTVVADVQALSYVIAKKYMVIIAGMDPDGKYVCKMWELVKNQSLSNIQWFPNRVISEQDIPTPPIVCGIHECTLVHMNSLTDVNIVTNSDMSKRLQIIQKINKDQYEPVKDAPITGEYVVVKYSDNLFYRGKITAVKRVNSPSSAKQHQRKDQEHQQQHQVDDQHHQHRDQTQHQENQEEDQKHLVFDVEYIDFGFNKLATFNQLYLADKHNDNLKEPNLLMKCQLNGVDPSLDNNRFESYVKNHIENDSESLIVKIINFVDGYYVIDLFVNSKLVQIHGINNEMVVRRNFSLDNQFHECYISHIHSLHKFFIRLISEEEMLNDLNKNFYDTMDLCPFVMTPVQDDLCICLDKLFNAYRGRILKVTFDPVSILILHIDYGSSNWYDQSKVFQADPRKGFFCHPPFAIQCHLSGISDYTKMSKYSDNFFNALFDKNIFTKFKKPYVTNGSSECIIKYKGKIVEDVRQFTRLDHLPPYAMDLAFKKRKHFGFVSHIEDAREVYINLDSNFQISREIHTKIRYNAEFSNLVKMDNPRTGEYCIARLCNLKCYRCKINGFRDLSSATLPFPIIADSATSSQVNVTSIDYGYTEDVHLDFIYLALPEHGFIVTTPPLAIRVSLSKYFPTDCNSTENLKKLIMNIMGLSFHFMGNLDRDDCMECKIFYKQQEIIITNNEFEFGKPFKRHHSCVLPSTQLGEINTNQSLDLNPPRPLDVNQTRSLDLRSPRSLDLRSPRSLDVRSPVSLDKKSPLSLLDVKSTSNFSDEYIDDEFTDQPSYFGDQSMELLSMYILRSSCGDE